MIAVTFCLISMLLCLCTPLTAPTVDPPVRGNNISRSNMIIRRSIMADRFFLIESVVGIRKRI